MAKALPSLSLLCTLALSASLALHPAPASAWGKTDEEKAAEKAEKAAQKAAEEEAERQEALANAAATCNTSISEVIFPLRYDAEDKRLEEHQSLREKMLGGWGRVTCPGYVTLLHMTPELAEATRGGFCLQWDGKKRTYIGYDYGPRDAYWNCKEKRASLCEKVQTKTDTAMEVAAVSTKTAATGAGVAVLAGSGAQVASALSTAGTSAAAALATPGVAAAAAVSVVTVGGLLYVCK